MTADNPRPPVTTETMTQSAPYPYELAYLVRRVRYKDGWTFTLDDLDRGQGSAGLTLCILIDTPDSYSEVARIRVMHYMIVPAAAYDRQSWQRWVFDQILLVERHEACEFFKIRVRDYEIKDGHSISVQYVRPYAPNHGPGRDPYTVFDYADDRNPPLVDSNH